MYSPHNAVKLDRPAGVGLLPAVLVEPIGNSEGTQKLG